MVAALQAGSVAGMVLPAGLHLVDRARAVAVRPAVPAAGRAGQDHRLRGAEQGRGQDEGSWPRRRAFIVIGFHGIGPQSFLTKFPVSDAGRHPGQEVPRHPVAAAGRRLSGLGRGAAADGVRRGLHRAAAGHARRHGEPARRDLQDEAARGGEVLHHHRALRLRLRRHRQQALVRRAAEGSAGRGDARPARRRSSSPTAPIPSRRTPASRR